MMLRDCQACGARFEQSCGRPRKFCPECVPPGTGAAAVAAWRAVNAERIAAYNEARRGGTVRLAGRCSECGAGFETCRPERVVCGEDCRRKRKLRLDRRRKR